MAEEKKQWQLLSIETGKELNVGDKAVIKGGNRETEKDVEVEILYLNPPKSMSSSGKVQVKLPDGFSPEYYPSVIDAYFKEKK